MSTEKRGHTLSLRERLPDEEIACILTWLEGIEPGGAGGAGGMGGMGGAGGMGGN